MNKLMSPLEIQLCDIQGRLFTLSAKKNLNSESFINVFMNSKTCAGYDLPYDRSQWAGEEYLLEEIIDEYSINTDGNIWNLEVLFWIGYVYRYWHFLTGETSKEIYLQADAQLMADVYLGFHQLSCELAIENLQEIAKKRDK